MLINLTGHEVHELESNTVIPSSGMLRSACDTQQLPDIDNIHVYRTLVHIPRSELPPKVDGVTYIVSALMLNSIPDYRTDFVAPKKVIRDNAGAIIGCKGFRKA